MWIRVWTDGYMVNRDIRLGSKVDKNGVKWDKSGTFPDQISEPNEPKEKKKKENKKKTAWSRTPR